MSIHGYTFEKQLPDGRMAAIMALTLGRARIIVGRADHWQHGYDDGY